MSQSISTHTPPERRTGQEALPEEAPFWQLESDRKLLKHLYAQREEQLQQLAALQQAGAREQVLRIVQGQIAMLDHTIQQTEEQAALHERQAKAHQAGQ